MFKYHVNTNSLWTVYVYFRTLVGLPKTSSGDVVSFRGWPSLQWVSTEKLPRPPRDWIPPPRPAEDSPAHIEHTSAADGSAMGVIVTR